MMNSTTEITHIPTFSITNMLSGRDVSEARGIDVNFLIQSIARIIYTSLLRCRFSTE